MKRHILFKHNVQLLNKADCNNCTQEEFETAIKKHTDNNLRFDNKTGVTRDDDGELCRYSNPSEFEPFTNTNDVIEWEFKRFINNSISRLRRGYEA